MQPVRIVSVAAAALAVVIAGCGSSGSSKPASTPTQGTAAPAATSSAASTAPAVVITTKPAKKLGTVLAAGPKKLTVYLFEADRGPASACAGACAAVWPPVTGKPSSSGTARAADLGTIKRADGSLQVTYKGHPLYTYSKDKDDGDVYGEGIESFGASWYVLAPSGKKVDLS